MDDGRGTRGVHALRWSGRSRWPVRRCADCPRVIAWASRGCSARAGRADGAGVISQFEGYEDLLELNWPAYRTTYGEVRRLDRILEAEGDSVAQYKVSEQADAVMLFYLLSDLADVQGGTTREGVHLAAMAGSADLTQRCFHRPGGTARPPGAGPLLAGLAGCCLVPGDVSLSALDRVPARRHRRGASGSRDVASGPGGVPGGLSSAAAWFGGVLSRVGRGRRRLTATRLPPTRHRVTQQVGRADYVAVRVEVAAFASAAPQSRARPSSSGRSGPSTSAT
jgi:hypothetical protein